MALAWYDTTRKSSRRLPEYAQIVPLHSAEIKNYSCFGVHENHMVKFSDSLLAK